MTAEKLHDALTLLPSDLITATNQLRMAPKSKIIPWKKILPAAACFVLLLGLGIMIRQENLLGHMMLKESAAEAPAAMAPLPEGQKITADEAAPAAPAADAPAEEAGGSVNGMEEELWIDHSHRFAEEEEKDDPAVGYDGNLTAAIDVAGERFTISGSDAVAVTDILVNLEYDPDNVCRCMTDITVDTEMLTGIRVDLAQGFARCELGQAALTEAQVQTIREIIEKHS